MNTEHDEQQQKIEASILRIEQLLKENPDKREAIFSELKRGCAATIATADRMGLGFMIIDFPAYSELTHEQLRTAVRQLTITSDEISHAFSSKAQVRAEELREAIGWNPVEKVLKDKPKWKNGRNGALNRIICKPQYT